MDATFKSYEHGLADQEVADIQLLDLRDGSDGFDIAVSQTVAGMNLKPDALPVSSCLLYFEEHQISFWPRGIGIRTGMQFNDRRSQGFGSLKLVGIGLNEHGDLNICCS